MKTRVPIFITAFVGIFMILKYFVVTPWVSAVADELNQWGVVTLAFAIILGVLNLAKINTKAVVERKKDWGYKLILLLGMVFMMTAGGTKWYLDIRAENARVALEAVETAADATPEMVAAATAASTAAQASAAENLFSFAFNRIYNPLSATMYSLLAFYVASAAFRSFRAKNVHATLLLLAAILVMIGRVPVGGLLQIPLDDGSIWRPLVWVQDWLMTWPNAAGQRAIQMGAAIGMIATGLRVIFGIERPYLKG